MFHAKPNKSRYHREKGENFVHPLWAKLDAMAKEKLPNGAPRFYFFMHKYPKIGLNPYASYTTTPLGIYAYLLDTNYLNLLKTNALPYVPDAQYVTILEATQADRMLYIDSNPLIPPILDVDTVLLKQDEARCERILSALKNVQIIPNLLANVRKSIEPQAIKEIEIVLTEFHRRKYKTRFDGDISQGLWSMIAQFKGRAKNSPFSLYRSVRKSHLPASQEQTDLEESLAGKGQGKLLASATAKMTADLIRRGYTSVCDAGTSAIHSNEPAQIVFLTPTSFRVIETLPNIYRRLEQRTLAQQIGELKRANPELWRNVQAVLDKDQPGEELIRRWLYDVGSPDFNQPDGWYFLTTKAKNGVVRATWVYTKVRPDDLTSPNTPAHVPFFSVTPTVLDLLIMSRRSHMGDNASSSEEIFNLLLRALLANPAIEVKDLLGEYPDDPIKQRLSDNTQDIVWELIKEVRGIIQSPDSAPDDIAQELKKLKTKKFWPHLSVKGTNFLFVPKLFSQEDVSVKNYFQAISQSNQGQIINGQRSQQLKEFLKQLETPSRKKA